MKTKYLNVFFIFLIILVAFFAIKAFWPTYGKPPGCNKSSSIGGCYGKNELREINISTNLPDCIQIEAKNCQHAQLSVQNLCDNVELYIEEQSINSKYETSLSYTMDEQGNAVRTNDSNFYPTEDEEITLNATLNGEPFTISYVRSAPLCE